MSTTIEWTDETWNPVVGCERVSPGCDHCYAIGVAHRAMQPAHVGLTVKRPGEATDWTGVVRCLPERLDQPLRWKRPRRVFVNSMSDLFHPDVPRAFISKCFAAMACAAEHTFQVLTKRPRRMAAVTDDPWFSGEVDTAAFELDRERSRRYEWCYGYLDGRTQPNHWLSNVWLGTSIESRRYAWRAEHLRETPAAVRFLSVEPMLGHLGCDLESLEGIHWVIVGAESGPGARPMDLEWARGLRDRCAEEGVAFFVKQLSGPGGKAIKDIDQFPEDLRIREMTPQRIQLRRTRGWRKPANAINVARPTRWGNPFKLSDYLPHYYGIELTEAARMATSDFRGMLEGKWDPPDGSHPYPIGRIPELAGHDLACWCPLEDANGNRPCHADVLLEFANPGWTP